MYLIFPESMIVRDVVSRREDTHFEDWLTATLIENTNRESPGDNESCLPGITDLWLLEIAERNGRTWIGKFNVEFESDARRSSTDFDLPPRELPKVFESVIKTLGLSKLSR